MLRKLKHVGKKACKYKFTIALNHLDVHGTKAWQPFKLALVCTRRKKRISGKAQSWRPSLENPYNGVVTWSGHNQEALEIHVTFFREQSGQSFEPKDWVFVLENETRNGKRKPIATVRMDMCKYILDVPSPQPIEVQMKPLNRKLLLATLKFTLTCIFMSEKLATEADLASMAGSTTSEDTIHLGDIDIANVHDFDDSEVEGSSRGSTLDGHTTKTSNNIQRELHDLTQQIESFKFPMSDLDTSSQKTSSAVDVIDVQSAKSGSRHTSTSSVPSEKTSTSHGSSNDNKRIDASTLIVENDVPDNMPHSKEKRLSQSSEASHSSTPKLKRRLRPSVDFLPQLQSEESENLQQIDQPSSVGNSPATDNQKALLRWCQRVTAGHQGVKVTNFTTSWRNGLALCAILHHYKPDLIDYTNLKSLDGKQNIKKAFDGFRSLGLPFLQNRTTSSISDKSSLIFYLTKIREAFEQDAGDQNGSLSQLSNRPNLLNSPVLCQMARVKLLSDLEEKEDEDDVFSAALDEVLEQESETLSEQFSPEASTCAFRSSNTSVTCPVAVNAEPKILPGVTSNSVTSVDKISNQSSDNVADIKLETTSFAPEMKAEEVSFDVKEDITQCVSLNFYPENNSTPIDTHIPSVHYDNTDVVQSATTSNLCEDQNSTRLSLVANKGIDSPTAINNCNSLGNLLEKVEVPSNEVPVFELHVDDAYSNKNLSESPDVIDGRESVDVTNNSSPNTSPKLTKVGNGVAKICSAKAQQHSSSEHVPFEPAVFDSNLDQHQSFNEEETVRLKADDPLQETVEQLLKASAERSKKTKTMELIEKAKADALASAQSPKREVSERAQKLIDEARATLGRTNKPIKQLPKDDQGSPSLGAQSCASETSTKRHSTDGRGAPFNGIGAIPATAKQSESDSVVNALENSSSASLSKSNSSSGYESQTRDTTDESLCEHANGTIDANLPVERPIGETNLGGGESLKGAADPIDDASEIKSRGLEPSETEVPHVGSSPLLSYHPLQSPLHEIVSPLNPFLAEDRDKIHVADGEGKGFVMNVDIVSDDLDLRSSESNVTPSLQGEGIDFDTNALSPKPQVEMRRSHAGSASLVDRLSVASTSDLHRRLSTALQNKDGSTINVLLTELEKERLSLEKEHKLVEERSAEVQLELQDLKSTSSRGGKEREGQLMQEWFQLVHKKNAILRQQDQLALMEEEQEILEKVDRIHKELIPLMEIEDVMKTLAQQEREQILLEEKFRLVNERDRIMQDMNEKEQMALDEEERLQTSLGENMSKVIKDDEKCVVM